MRTGRVFVNTFKNYDSEPRNNDIAPLKFIVNDKTITVEALRAPFICSDIFGQNVRHASRNYAHFKNLKLADPFDADCKKINILIGLYPYFKFMTGNIRRGNENEPNCVKAHFQPQRIPLQIYVETRIFMILII